MAQSSWDIKVAPDLRRCSLRFRILVAPLWFHWPVSLQSLFKVLHPTNMTLNQPKKKTFQRQTSYVLSSACTVYIKHWNIWNPKYIKTVLTRRVGRGWVPIGCISWQGGRHVEGDLRYNSNLFRRSKSSGKVRQRHQFCVLYKGTRQNKKESVRILILYIRSLFLISWTSSYRT